MTIDTIKRKINDLEKTNAWNYMLVAAAVMTAIISLKNIAIYTKSIREGKKLIT